MTADHARREAPSMVTTLVGMVVAVVSAVFGISAHGMAAGAGAALPSSEQILMVLGASAGIGAVTADLARRYSPVLLSAAGLLAGQGLVHLVLISGHSHGGGGHGGGGHASHLAGHGGGGHAINTAVVQSAMNGVGGGSGAGGHIDALLTPGMLVAHLAAIGVTLAVVAALAGTLSWVAARVVRLVVGAHLVVVDKLVLPGRIATADARYLLAGGGTRAPPVTV